MASMFQAASSFNSDLSKWQTERVTGMRNMFSAATSFNADTSQWNIARVVVMSSMFDGASSFVQNLRPWTDRSTANGGLSASTSTSDMGYVVLSAKARSTLEANTSLLALGNETDAAPAACTSPAGVPCHALYAGTPYAVGGAGCCRCCPRA